MYIINDYQLIEVASEVYVTNGNKGARIPHPALASILSQLKQQPLLEITDEQLAFLASEQNVHVDQLKQVLINQLKVLKPMLARKFPLICINSNDRLIVELLEQTLAKQYRIEVVAEDCVSYPKDSLLLFYRHNYSSREFKNIHQHLQDDVYLITAGGINQLLIIDNLYYNGSGLPTHVSNLQQLMAYLHTNVPATKNNWLLYYRKLAKHNIDEFPDPNISACQKGYIAYCLLQFMSQFTNLWETPTPLDQLNWFWHVDLNNFTVHREVALHSPFSEFDMKLNLSPVVCDEVA